MTAREQILTIEAADAWFEYLEASRAARETSELRYREVEPWAWAKLTARLRSVEARSKGRKAVAV